MTARSKAHVSLGMDVAELLVQIYLTCCGVVPRTSPHLAIHPRDPTTLKNQEERSVLSLDSGHSALVIGF